MDEADSTIKSLSTLNFLFGLWLIISPYLLNYTTAQSKWQQTIAGILIAIFAAVRFFAPSQVWASWINVLIGVWLIIAPFATNYKATASYWNEVIFGILVVLVGLANGFTHSSGEQHHGSPAH